MLYEILQGIKQKEEGERLKKSLVTPVYSTPKSVTDAYDTARSYFTNTSRAMPGQQQAENTVQGNTAQAVGLAQQYGTNPAGIMAGIVGANANENRATNDLNVEAANQYLGRRFQNLQTFLGQAGLVGDYADKEFAYNKWMPYGADRQYAESLIGAGTKNISNSFGNARSLVANIFSYGQAGGQQKDAGASASSGDTNYTAYRKDRSNQDPNASNAFRAWGDSN